MSSSPRCGGFPPSDSDSDPEREFSGDDDDRNHKHRRRETRSQASEFDVSESVSSRPFRKRKAFENGHAVRDINNSFAPSEKDKRRFGVPTFSRAPMDLNQRGRVSQPYFGDSGFGRGSGRDSWNPRDRRFGSVSSSLYVGRGMPNVVGMQSAPWNPYGLLPGVPSSGLDAMHPLGINSTLRPSINTPLSVPCQKCRDFEERGFCLRGDMCPMEHGVNRIVVDDVQSLSQFNLPVSLPTADPLVGGGGPGLMPSSTASTSFSHGNSKSQSKMGKPKSGRRGVDGEAGCNGAFPSSTAAGDDFYDPDQPLLNKDGPGTSSVTLPLPCSPTSHQAEFVQDREPPGGTLVRVQDVRGSKNTFAQKEKVNIMSNQKDNSRDKEEMSNSTQAAIVQGIQASLEGNGSIVLDSSQRKPNDNLRNTRQLSEKAQAHRTLFVNGIPLENNIKQALCSHFQKFGEIVDIYIPSNTGKAFVQFSKREEAETALKAPDAVMGNRFIRLWWANRDNIPDGGLIGNNGFTNAHIGAGYSGPSQLHATNYGRVNPLSAPKVSVARTLPTAPKVNIVCASKAPLPASDQSKQFVTNGPTAQAPSHKKLESLEVLKEEIRKKQEMLDKKRNEFKRQLDRLEKQAGGSKGEISSEQHAKRQKVTIATDEVNILAQQSVDINKSVAPSKDEVLAEKTESTDKLIVSNPNRLSTLLPQESVSLNASNPPSTAEGEHLDVDITSQNNGHPSSIEKTIKERDGDEKAHEVHFSEEDVVEAHGKQLAGEEEGNAVKTYEEQLCDVDAHEEQLSDEEHSSQEFVVLVHDEQPSDGKVETRHEEHPYDHHDEYAYDEHSCEEGVDEEKRQSEDDFVW